MIYVVVVLLKVLELAAVVLVPYAVGYLANVLTVDMVMPIGIRWAFGLFLISAGVYFFIILRFLAADLWNANVRWALWLTDRTSRRPGAE
jgi:hypothetical protein